MKSKTAKGAGKSAGPKKGAGAKESEKPGFFRRHLSFYLSSWRSFAQWWTLLHISIDIALVLFALVLLSLNTAVFVLISEPLLPTLQAIGELESSGIVSDADRAALLEQYRPDVTSILVKAGLAAFGLYLLFIVAYAAAKTRIWTSLQGRAMTWREFGWNLLLTAAWLILGAGVPLALALVAPIVAAYLLVATILLTIIFLPLLYATHASRPLLSWRIIGNYLFISLLAVLSLGIVSNALSLFARMSEGVAFALLLVWFLVFAAWGRHYIDRFVAAEGL